MDNGKPRRYCSFAIGVSFNQNGLSNINEILKIMRNGFSTMEYSVGMVSVDLFIALSNSVDNRLCVYINLNNNTNGISARHGKIQSVMDSIVRQVESLNLSI